MAAGKYGALPNGLSPGAAAFAAAAAGNPYFSSVIKSGLAAASGPQLQHPGLNGSIHPPTQPLAPIPQGIHPPFQSPTTPVRISGTPDVAPPNEAQRSSPSSTTMNIDRPLSSSPPANVDNCSPKTLNLSGPPSSLPQSSPSSGFTKPPVSSSSSSLFFPHLSPAASLAAASSTAAFYSGLRNLQQFQQQQAAAAAAAALHGTASSPHSSSALGSTPSNPDNSLRTSSQISPPLFNALRLPTSSGFVPISVSPKYASDSRISDASCVNGGASPPRISPRSISAFSVESNS